ncbi:MAG: P-loop NTPase [Candidatus Muiribacteriaceae bacterium]
MKSAMRIAVASGKGGTGKTTVATCLAHVAAELGRKVTLIDCDVEEPNSHIFLKPLDLVTESIEVEVPEIDYSACIECGKCDGLCEFNALFYIKGKPMTFEDMCHSCGFCMRVCPVDAIKRKKRRIGDVVSGKTGSGVNMMYGLLDIGQILSPHIIRKLKQREKPESHELIIYDAPPGTSCSVVASIRDADHVVLVTEPTPFGLHDLQLAVNMCKDLGRDHSVFINREDRGWKGVEEYCEKEGVQIIGTLPYMREIAEKYSEGELIIKGDPALRGRFVTLQSKIEGRVRR